MPSPAKQRGEGTMGKKLMVCLGGEKSWDQKETTQKNHISMKLVLNNLKEQKRLYKVQIKTLLSQLSGKSKDC